jgi:putative DNA primase/helicase
VTAVYQEDFIQAFRDAMAKEGIKYSGQIIADGKFHRDNADEDRKGKKNLWYVLHLDDRAAGMFGWNKLGNETKFSWSAEGLKPLTREERKALADRVAAERARREREEAERHEAARALSQTLWDGASEAPSDHPYLVKKQVASYGLRRGVWKKPRPDGSLYTLASDALLVPLRDEQKVTWGLQAIFASPVMVGGEERGKDFVYGARKQGLWFSIGKPAEVDGVKTVALCEGYATGCSIHESTGLAVLVCFDAGNLVHVAKIARRLMPGARLIICADNDQWTTRTNGDAWNPGVEKATDAAKTVDGVLAVPWFSDVNRKPTDFNDLRCISGLEEVARQVFAAFRAEAPRPPEEAPPWEDAQGAGAGLPVNAPEGSHLVPIEGGKDAGDGKKRKKRERPPADFDAMRDNAWFRVLGHNRDSVFVFQTEMKMVVCRKQTDWGRNAFLALANLAWWQQNFPGGGKDGFDTGMATNALLRLAFERGYYDPTRTRGRGAWRDRGRFIYHFGGKLLVDGEEMEVTDLESNYVYEQGRHLNLPPPEAMSGLDGNRIIRAAQVFHWTRPASAILLAGWVALAPLSGALRWRPHIWITGGTGSGKSTILNDYIWFLMNGLEVYAQGNSTEAGIRQTLEMDALPVLFDESEQNDQAERMRVQAILALIRQASTESGAKTLKGTQIGQAQGFMIRSMFALSSVQVGLRHQADIERMSVLALRPKREGDAAANWAVIKAAVDELKADPTLPGRLLRRSIQLIPITVQNIETFARVAAQRFGSQREGDQFGAMLAGAWSLVKSTIVTEEEALNMIQRYDWSDYTEGSEKEESTKALETLLERLIRTNSGEVSVYELLMRAAGREGEGAWTGSTENAVAHLARHGMKIKWVGAKRDARNGAFLVANNSSSLAELMADTPYASDVKGQLGRVPGAFKTEAEKFNGITSRSIGIPLVRVLDNLDPPTPYVGDDIPF